MLFNNKEKVLNRARELCIRIREESENPQLIKDAINLELLSLIMDNKPTEVLEILGEDVKTFSQDAELISMSFKLLGNMNKASEITQICIYLELAQPFLPSLVVILYHPSAESSTVTLSPLFTINLVV